MRIGKLEGTAEEMKKIIESLDSREYDYHLKRIEMILKFKNIWKRILSIFKI